MKNIIFHGDADGIASAAIYMAKNPSEKYNPVSFDKFCKKNYGELKEGDSVILDISSSMKDLKSFIDQKIENSKIKWIDHHYHKTKYFGVEYNLTDDKEQCNASFLNDEYSSKFNKLAILGCFGDNKVKKAKDLRNKSKIPAKDYGVLRRLGRTLNYNSFDVMESPNKILDAVSKQDYEKVEKSQEIAKIKKRFYNDLKEIRKHKLERKIKGNKIIIKMPDIEASKRIFPEYAYMLQRNDPNKTYFIFVPDETGYILGIRAPRKAKDIAEKFGGGGRETAAAAHIATKNLNLDEIVRNIG